MISLYKPRPHPIDASVSVICEPSSLQQDHEFQLLFEATFGPFGSQAYADASKPQALAYIVEKLARNRHRWVASTIVAYGVFRLRGPVPSLCFCCFCA